MAHIKKHWWKYLLLILAATYVITSLVKDEWNPLNWFSGAAGGRQMACSKDASGDCFVGTGGQREYVDCRYCRSITA